MACGYQDTYLGTLFRYLSTFGGAGQTISCQSLFYDVIFDRHPANDVLARGICKRLASKEEHEERNSINGACATPDSLHSILGHIQIV